MGFRHLSAPGLSRKQILAAVAAATLTVSTVARAQAQQPPLPAAGMPAEAQEQAPRQQVIYTPWTKYCLKTPDGRQTCFIGKDGRVEAGQPVIAAVVIEPEGDPKNILRVTLPLGVQLLAGTRVLVDNNPPAQSPYVICFANGCVSDYEMTAELLASMKKGQNLMIQAINSNGAPMTLPFPLQETGGGFAKAYDGLPPDPKVIEENYKKVQEELQKRADEHPNEAEPPAAATTSGPAEK
jgi:invasion protein IalB